MKEVYYCSEECMEQYLEKQDLSYEPFPCEDTYLMLRQEYIDLIDH